MLFNIKLPWSKMYTAGFTTIPLGTCKKVKCVKSRVSQSPIVSIWYNLKLTLDS